MKILVGPPTGEREWHHWGCPNPECEVHKKNIDDSAIYGDVELVRDGSFVRFECYECKTTEVEYIGPLSKDGYALMNWLKTGEILDLRVIVNSEIFRDKIK